MRAEKGIHICGCWWNERIKVKTEGSTRLTYCDTGLRVGSFGKCHRLSLSLIAVNGKIGDP